MKERVIKIGSINIANKSTAMVFSAVLAMVAPNALALSGEDMSKYCAANACGGYFIGAFDGLRIAGAVGSEKQRKMAAICAPSEVTDEEIVDVALAYLERHDELQHLSAANLALRAWREQWPCRK